MCGHCCSIVEAFKMSSVVNVELVAEVSAAQDSIQVTPYWAVCVPIFHRVHMFANHIEYAFSYVHRRKIHSTVYQTSGALFQCHLSLAVIT